jgi:hypothetical protein
MMNNYDSRTIQRTIQSNSIYTTLTRTNISKAHELAGKEIMAEVCTFKPRGNNSFLVEVIYSHALVTKSTTWAQHDSIGGSSNTT